MPETTLDHLAVLEAGCVEHEKRWLELKEETKHAKEQLDEAIEYLRETIRRWKEDAKKTTLPFGEDVPSEVAFTPGDLDAIKNRLERIAAEEDGNLRDLNKHAEDEWIEDRVVNGEPESVTLSSGGRSVTMTGKPKRARKAKP